MVTVSGSLEVNLRVTMAAAILGAISSNSMACSITHGSCMRYCMRYGDCMRYWNGMRHWNGMSSMRGSIPSMMSGAEDMPCAVSSVPVSKTVSTAGVAAVSVPGLAVSGVGVSVGSVSVSPVLVVGSVGAVSVVGVGASVVVGLDAVVPVGCVVCAVIGDDVVVAADLEIPKEKTLEKLFSLEQIIQTF